MPAGIFLTHVVSPRVRRHYDRLVAQTAGLVNWHFVLNPAPGMRATAKFRFPDPRHAMPVRHEQMTRNGGVQGGFVDVVVIACVLGLRARNVWVMEYDVDYSGDWAELFAQFDGLPADLLTSTLTPLEESLTWHYWQSATAPAWVGREQMVRAFNPLMRISRRFAREYALMMSDPHWQGHYEFTLPTAAIVSGATISDLGPGPASDALPSRRQNYRNSPHEWLLSPGTFVWRPARAHYFHERPDAFDEPGLLYHPVKPNIAAWATKPESQPSLAE